MICAMRCLVTLVVAAAVAKTSRPDRQRLLIAVDSRPCWRVWTRRPCRSQHRCCLSGCWVVDDDDAAVEVSASLRLRLCQWPRPLCPSLRTWCLPQANTCCCLSLPPSNAHLAHCLVVSSSIGSFLGSSFAHTHTHTHTVVTLETIDDYWRARPTISIGKIVSHKVQRRRNNKQLAFLIWYCIYDDDEVDVNNNLQWKYAMPIICTHATCVRQRLLLISAAVKQHTSVRSERERERTRDSKRDSRHNTNRVQTMQIRWNETSDFLDSTRVESGSLIVDVVDIWLFFFGGGSNNNSINSKKTTTA